MSAQNFFGELKRRNVYKVAVAYAVVAWLLIQLASILFPTFEAPAWVMKVFVAIVALGFPIAVVLAWAFELTPQGIQLTAGVAHEAQPKSRMRRAVFWSLVAVGAVAGVLLSLYVVQQRAAAPASTPKQPGAKRAVAVLPFENLSEDKANAYFADGMQDEIITRLAKVGDLKVISRTSTLPYKTKPEKVSEVARQLGVGHVVEGTVQRIADRVRINVQLIEAETDEHLWAELYDRNVADVFEMQSEVATKIAGSLQAKLSGREQKAMAEKPTENVAAYDAYLRGIDFDTRPGQTPDDDRNAADAFAEAVRLDPKFAQAWARLSRSCSSLYFQHSDGTEARKELARSAAETATRLSPDDPETLLANAYYRYHIERDYDGARRAFEQMHREAPSSSVALEALARIARRQSRWTDAIRLLEEAMKLNPRDPNLFMDLSWSFSMIRDFPATLRMIERAEAIRPNDWDIIENKAFLFLSTGDLAAAQVEMDKIPPAAKKFDVRIVILTLQRRYEEALQMLEQKLADPVAASPQPAGMAHEWRGYLRRLAGDAEGAKKAYLEAKPELERMALDQPKNFNVAGVLARVEAGLGNKDAALREAERGVAALPASEDPVLGPSAEENLAEVEAAVGEHERAIARVERLLRTPYGAYPLTVAELRLSPNWDPLREHPRFKAIIDGPEPKTIYK